MKLFILIITFFLIPITIFAQLDTTTLKAIENYHKLELENGMRVLFIQTDIYEYAEYRLIIDYVPFNENEFAGTLELITEIVGAGRANMRGKHQITIDRTSHLHSNAVDSLLETMYKNIILPKFSLFQINQTKKILQTKYSDENNPDSLIFYYSKKNNFGEQHPYSEIINRETISNITQSNIIQTHNQIFNPKNAYLIIIGDLETYMVDSLTRKHFDSWQDKSSRKQYNNSIPTIDETEVIFINKDTLETYISVTYPLKYNIPNGDFITSRVIHSILKKNININLPVQNNETRLCYDPFIGFFSVTTKQNDYLAENTVNGIMQQITSLTSSMINPTTLQQAKSEAQVEFKNSFKNPYNIIQYVYNIDKYLLPKNYYTNYLQKLNNITPTNIQQTAKNYLKPNASSIIIIGKEAELYCQLVSLSQNYNVKFHDSLFHKFQVYPKEFGSQSIINNYLYLCQAKNNIPDIAIYFEAEYLIDTMSYNLKGTIYKKYPSYYYYETKLFLETDTLFHHIQVCDGEKWMDSTIVGGKIFSEQEEVYQRIYKAYLFPELFFDELNFEHEYICDTALYRQGVHKIKITTPYNVSYYDYYSLEDRRKIRTEKIEQQNNNLVVTETYEYSDYNEIDATTKIQLPYLIIQNYNSITIKMKIIDVDTKINLKKKLFKINEQ